MAPSFPEIPSSSQFVMSHCQTIVSEVNLREEINGETQKKRPDLAKGSEVKRGRSVVTQELSELKKCCDISYSRLTISGEV